MIMDLEDLSYFLTLAHSFISAVPRPMSENCPNKHETDIIINTVHVMSICNTDIHAFGKHGTNGSRYPTVNVPPLRCSNGNSKRYCYKHAISANSKTRYTCVG